MANWQWASLRESPLPALITDTQNKLLLFISQILSCHNYFKFYTYLALISEFLSIRIASLNKTDKK
jgi:hypothetical protein